MNELDQEIDGEENGKEALEAKLADEELLPPISVKQGMLESLEKDVTQDYFLYCTLEAERTLRAVEKMSDTGHWPGLADVAGSDEAAFLAAIDTMSGWYVAEYPDMHQEGVCNYERVGGAFDGFAYFTNDLRLLSDKVRGAKLPTFKEDEPSELWSGLDGILTKHFGRLGSLYGKFLQWTYGEEWRETSEPGSRPPIGRYAPRLPRTDGPRSRPSDGRGGDGRRGGRDSGPGGRGPRRERDSGRPPRSEARGEGRGGEGRGGEGSRDRPRRPRRDGPRDGVGTDGANAQQEAEAMQEVARAISLLSADHDLEEVVLKPSNSFYRRLQHQEAKEKGFGSESVGEGPDRAVKILRDGAFNR